LGGHKECEVKGRLDVDKHIGSEDIIVKGA